MGLLTLTDWRAELEGGLQRAGVSSTLQDKWVNQALKEFGYAFRFHELEASAEFSTVIGIGEYAIGSGLAVDVSDFRYLEELWAIRPDSESAYKVRPETRGMYLTNIGVRLDSTTYGTPVRYHRFGNKVILRPTPDAVMTLTMDYYKTIPRIVQPTDTSPFHEDWDEAISIGALYRGFRHFGEFDRYQNVRNDFLGLVRSRSTEFELEEFPEGGINPITADDIEDREGL